MVKDRIVVYVWDEGSSRSYYRGWFSPHAAQSAIADCGESLYLTGVRQSRSRRRWFLRQPDSMLGAWMQLSDAEALDWFNEHGYDWEAIPAFRGMLAGRVHMDEVVQICVTAADKDAWRNAADVLGLPLSAWLRRMANEYIQEKELWRNG